jgi:hypothetical protein
MLSSVCDTNVHHKGGCGLTLRGESATLNPVKFWAEEMENTDCQRRCQPWPEETFIAACNRAIFLYLVSMISK